MIEADFDDYTVMEISGHSSTHMLARYTHPTDERKLDALGSFSLSTNTPQSAPLGDSEVDDEMPVTGDPEWVVVGGPHGTRTHDLRVANAALSQLS